MGRIEAFANRLMLVTLGSLALVSASQAGPSGGWTVLTPPGSFATGGHCAIFDPSGDRMIVVGPGTWSFKLDGSNTWTNLNSFSRLFASAIYDPVRNRMVMFGGEYNNDTWTLPMTGAPAWTSVTPLGSLPAAREYATAVYDPGRDRMLVFGGLSQGGALNDVWELSFAGTTPTWTQLAPSGQPPSPRWAHCAVYDPLNDRVVVFGGVLANGDLSSETWSLSLTGTPIWSQITGAGPSARELATAIYDPNFARMVVFGGYDGAFRNDTWELSLSGATPTWTALTPSGTLPAGRDLHTAVYDAPGSRMVVYAGNNTNLISEMDFLTWPGAGGAPTLSGFSPIAGQPGDLVSISGAGLQGVTSVSFNGVTSPSVQVVSDFLIKATVPDGATTGRLRVDTPQGFAISSNDFTIGQRPRLDSVTPTQAKFRSAVEIHGAYLTGTTLVRFGASPGTLQIHVDADSQVTAIVDSLATTGPIIVTNGIGPTTSTFTFTVIPPDTMPRITAVRDVPNDQGGKVFVSWLASDVDFPGHGFITGYRVWRRMPPVTAQALAGHRPRPDVLVRPRPDGSTIDYWEALATLPATYLAGYAYTAATTQDSLPGGNPYTAFFVQALTTDVFAFYNSSIDSGYSVDNLAPPAPQPFTAVYGPSSVALHWLPSAVPDLAGYRLYRGADASFVPGQGSLIASLTDTGYVDAGGNASSVYKLSAIDVHGNESRYVMVSPSGPTGTLISLVNADASGGDVKLTWFASGNAGMSARLERIAPGGAWQALAKLVADGAGYLRYDDRDVVVGGRYGYRLVALDGGNETTFAETWVEIVPPGLALAISNPVRGAALELDATLTGEAPARLEVLDIAGRRLAAVQLGLPGAGVHHVSLPLSARSGVVLVRLTEGAHTLVRRAVIAR